jgi:hypothetical protein
MATRNRSSDKTEDYSESDLKVEPCYFRMGYFSVLPQQEILPAPPPVGYSASKSSTHSRTINSQIQELSLFLATCQTARPLFLANYLAVKLLTSHLSSTMSVLDKYGPEVQKVPADAPIEDIIALLKRDGGVFVKGLISEADVDKAYDECRARLDSDVEWAGNFFPSKFSLLYLLV